MTGHGGVGPGVVVRRGGRARGGRARGGRVGAGVVVPVVVVPVVLVAVDPDRLGNVGWSQQLLESAVAPVCGAWSKVTTIIPSCL